MIFLLYLNEEILECYGQVDILRLSLLILIYKLYISQKINKISYKKLEEKLEENPFTLDNFNDHQLKEELIDIGIKIEISEIINNDKEVLKKILKHIENSFDQLEEILSKDIRIIATIPGENAFKHRLGTMYVEDWKLINFNNYKQLAEEMHQYIAERIINLISVFDDRIKFGDVLYQNASELNYQLWSANIINYNTQPGDKIYGDYQAQEMKIQTPGSFPIIVTPRYGY